MRYSRPMSPHPIRLVVNDDLRRSRLTVFFRLLLVIPHVIWLLLWGVVAAFAVLANWVVTLFSGRSPDALHRFLSAFVRYQLHVGAYACLVSNRFPGFLGRPGDSDVDLEIDPPETQNRWVTGFRVILGLPALLLAGALMGSGGFGSVGAVATIAILGWFAALALGTMPVGMRDLGAYGLAYQAQANAYLYVLTDRYPSSDPEATGRAEAAPAHPVRLSVDDDLQRSRLTVFFRLLLAIPHFFWLMLWGVAAMLATLANGIVTFVRGESPAGLHRFLAAYVRYAAHVSAFVGLVANPFPGFVGAAGSYPVDVEIDDPQPQSRAKTFFRLFLALPAFLISSALQGAAFTAAILGWFAALFTGQMPQGLRNLGAVEVRYLAQLYAYMGFLTDRYPYSGPVSATVRAGTGGTLAPPGEGAPVAPASPEPAASDLP